MHVHGLKVIACHQDMHVQTPVLGAARQEMHVPIPAVRACRPKMHVQFPAPTTPAARMHVQESAACDVPHRMPVHVPAAATSLAGLHVHLPGGSLIGRHMHGQAPGDRDLGQETHGPEPSAQKISRIHTRGESAVMSAAMKPRILGMDTPVEDLRQEIFHTLARLRAYPFLVTQVGLVEALLPELSTLQQQEIAIELEELEAETRVITADEGIDFLSTAISATLDALTGRDRKAPLYQRYFGSTSPSKLRRPVLGEQLAVMRTWVPSLTAPESAPALRAYGDQLAARVVEADQAVQARSEAGRKRADFDLGPRKAFVDRFNALRLSLYGQLAELAHGKPELGLPSDFATPFFLRDTRNRQLSLSELEQSILRLRERLQRQEAELARRLEEEALVEKQRAAQELAEAEAELSAMEDELAETEKQRAELAARVAALREQKKDK
jgi:hypothetical protein